MKTEAMMKRLIAALLMTCLAGIASAQDRKLPLVDEAASDPSWMRFKKRLQAAIQSQDKPFLLSILDPKIRNQSESTRGVAQFRRQWDLDTTDSPVWRELALALQLGSAYMQRDTGTRELCAPYVLAKWPGDLAPFENAVVISRDTSVQPEPSDSAQALGTLSYDVVRVTDWEVDDKIDAKQKWVKIRYRNREGYVLEEHVRSPIEHAACFVKSGNNWRMTGFAPAGGE
ncbi:MAG: hypothetical protein V4637_03275 [Pseudomonadota bacterium]